MEQKTEASQAVDERALFEKAMNDQRFFPRELDFSMTKSPSGRDEYANTHLQSCWVGWSARAALKAQPAEIDPALLRALREACDLAMKNTVATRVPECGDFGAIAQDLDYVISRLKAQPAPHRGAELLRTLRQAAACGEYSHLHASIPHRGGTGRGQRAAGCRSDR